MLDLESNARRRWPPPFVEPSFWQNFPSSLWEEVSGATKLASHILFHARWQGSVVRFGSVSSPHLVVLVSFLLPSLRSFFRWLELMTATPRLGDQQALLEILPKLLMLQLLPPTPTWRLIYGRRLFSRSLHIKNLLIIWPRITDTLEFKGRNRNSIDCSLCLRHGGLI